MTSDVAPRSKELLLCIGASVAAASCPLIMQYLLERGAVERIHVILSKRARGFVGESLLAILSGAPCIVDLFEEAACGRPVHVELARRCSLAVVAPTTADLVGKLANGIVDDAITIALSVFTAPVVLVPAIHPNTLTKPATARNLERLKADGYSILGPVAGYSISEGRRLGRVGAMPGAEVVAAFVERELIALRTSQSRASDPTAQQGVAADEAEPRS
ncbi:MAG: hypothetical protein IPM79_25395 [Polyangiaceae bacterium]|nr:hypothetical protein [Polyangiaceae bacterium]